MRVEQIMSKPVIAVSLDDSVEVVRELFEVHRFHHVVVTDRHRVVGIISDRDLLHHVSLFVGKSFEREIDAATLRKRAHQIMTRSVVTVPPNTTIRAAARILFANNISCLPVTDEAGRCLGILTTADLLRWLIENESVEPGEPSQSRVAA